MFAAFSAACAAVVAYVYFGYPILVAMLARLRPTPQDYPVQTPPVSLVISAFNEQSVIEAKLRNSFAIDYPRELLEIIVVTDGSDDGTAALAERVCAERPGARVLHDPERNGKAAAMLRGADTAGADILVFSDANNMYEPDTISQIVAPFADPRVGAATGAKRIAAGDHEVGGGERAYLRYESFIKKQESRLGCCTAVIGELIAVRRGLMPVFPPGLVNDDFFLAMHVAREGYQVVYVPAALSLETPAESLQADAVRRRRMSAGRWQALAWWRITVPTRRPLVVWQVVSHKYLRLLLPLLLLSSPPKPHTHAPLHPPPHPNISGRMQFLST